MPEELEILPVEIHLPGLLKVLGEHLYSDPRVAIRELIQNAHDFLCAPPTRRSSHCKRL